MFNQRWNLAALPANFTTRRHCLWHCWEFSSTSQSFGVPIAIRRPGNCDPFATPYAPDQNPTWPDIQLWAVFLQLMFFRQWLSRLRLLWLSTMHSYFNIRYCSVSPWKYTLLTKWHHPSDKGTLQIHEILKPLSIVFVTRNLDPT